jgi:hypothetical protein
MFKYVFLAILAAVVYFVFVFEMQLTNQMIGNLFIGGIVTCFVVFLFFKFGLHYKIASLNRFATAFYYAVFEYKKVQTAPSDLSYVDSVRQQAEVALAANFDPTLSAGKLAIPVTLYSGKDPYLEELRAKIKEAEKLKLQSHQLDTRADILLDKTQEDMVEKNLVTGEQPKLLDRWFDMVEGTDAIIELTTNEVKEQGYGQAPDSESALWHDLQDLRIGGDWRDPGPGALHDHFGRDYRYVRGILPGTGAGRRYQSRCRRGDYQFAGGSSDCADDGIHKHPVSGSRSIPTGIQHV